MFSRSTHNINDIFYLFLSKYNIIPKVDKTHKTNIMQFTHLIKGKIHIYAADPNEIHVITYKEVKILLFDEYLRVTNNEKDGSQSLTNFFGKK